MKKFLKKILILLSIIITLLFFLELNVFPYNTNVMTAKNNLISQDNIEILILGNSHTFFGLTPALLKKKSINIANKSRKLETDYLILEKNINKLSSVNYVVLPISHYTFFTSNISVSEKRLYYNYFGIDTYKQDFFSNSLVLNESFRELILNSLFNNLKISKLGWRANDISYSYNESIINDRIGNVNEKVSRKEEIKKNKKYLTQIVNLCDINNIKLILLLPPYHPDFYKYTNNKYDHKNKQILSQIDLKNSLIIDSKDLHMIDNDYFENVDHLNLNGAKVFTKKIDSIINLNSNE